VLEKIATHDVQDITELFSLVDKCARVMRDMAGIHGLPQNQGKGARPT
jgi:hypothetical protein